MLIDSIIAVLFLILFFILGIAALLGWIVEGDRCDKERNRSADLTEENKLLTELNNELEKKANFLELQLELEKNKYVDNTESEENEGAA